MKLPYKFTQFLFASMTILLLICNGCKKSEEDPSPNNQGANEILMQNSTFSPSSITVPVNTTITWTNKDNTNHTVTSNTGAFDSGSIGSNGTFNHQFTTVGAFNYHCTFHSGMTGTVIVQ